MPSSCRSDAVVAKGGAAETDTCLKTEVNGIREVVVSTEQDVEPYTGKTLPVAQVPYDVLVRLTGTLMS